MSTQRGDVVVIDFPKLGEAHRKIRPAVVVSNNIANRYSSTVSVVLITEWNEKQAALPICVELPKGTAGATKRSVIDCGQIHTIDKSHIREAAATVPFALRQRIDDALRLHLAL